MDLHTNQYALQQTRTAYGLGGIKNIHNLPLRKTGSNHNGQLTCYKTDQEPGKHTFHHPVSNMYPNNEMGGDTAYMPHGTPIVPGHLNVLVDLLSGRHQFSSNRMVTSPQSCQSAMVIMGITTLMNMKCPNSCARCLENGRPVNQLSAPMGIYLSLNTTIPKVINKIKQRTT